MSDVDPVEGSVYVVGLRGWLAPPLKLFLRHSSPGEGCSFSSIVSFRASTLSF